MEHPHPLKKLPRLPESFKAYHCDTCNKTYEWWQLPYNQSNIPFYQVGGEDMRHRHSLDSIARAQIFEAFPDKQIKSKELYAKIKKANLDVTEEQAQSSFNHAYRELNKKGIRMIRCPNKRLFDEKFDCIQFGTQLEYADLFNKRIIRQWDLEFVQSLDKTRRNIVEDADIKYKERWLAAIDFFKKKRD